MPKVVISRQKHSNVFTDSFHTDTADELRPNTKRRVLSFEPIVLATDGGKPVAAKKRAKAVHLKDEEEINKQQVMDEEIRHYRDEVNRSWSRSQNMLLSPQKANVWANLLVYANQETQKDMNLVAPVPTNTGSYSEYPWSLSLRPVELFMPTSGGPGPISNWSAASAAETPLRTTMPMMLMSNINTASRAPVSDFHESSMRLLYPDLLLPRDDTHERLPPTVEAAARFLLSHQSEFPPFLHQPVSIELAQLSSQHYAQRTTPIDNIVNSVLRNGRATQADPFESFPIPVPDCSSDTTMFVDKGVPTIDQTNTCQASIEKPETSFTLAYREDRGMLSDHLIFLRQQIEFFQSTSDDPPSKGRNKSVALHQVGIRCRHCSHIPVGKRSKASTYFPSTLMGIYQAAHNINVEHFQSGSCSEMPKEVQTILLKTRAAKSACSGAGKAYWAYSAQKMGLIDTEDGIRFNHTRL